MKQLLMLLVFSVPIFFSPPKKKITLWLIGDSTMSVKETKAYPETGWGMPFVHFWDSSVAVDNRAQNGRSTKTFINENRWQPVVDNMQEGDYVFIQFGHNDEVSTKVSYTTETEFANNLKKYIQDTKNKKGIPVLLTPVARRKFDTTGRLQGTHELYSAIVRKVASENNALLIDLDTISQGILQEWGEEKSALLFNHLLEGEHPNYPTGKEDNTHFNELGARIIAEGVLAEIKKRIPELAERVILVPVKK